MFPLVLIAASAFAWDDPNRMPTAHVALVHALGAEHPWGVRLGANWMFALGDHCTYQERSCRWGEVVWPVASPAASLTWRGGPRFALQVDGEFGVAGLEMAHFGFMPMWEVAARAGLRFDFDEMAPALVLGGFALKSFGVTVRDGNMSTTYGAHGIGLRVDADTAWAFGGAFALPTFGAGLWLAPGAAYSLD